MLGISPAPTRGQSRLVFLFCSAKGPGKTGEMGGDGSGEQGGAVGQGFFAQETRGLVLLLLGVVVC